MSCERNENGNEGNEGGPKYQNGINERVEGEREKIGGTEERIPRKNGNHREQGRRPAQEVGGEERGKGKRLSRKEARIR